MSSVTSLLIASFDCDLGTNVNVCLSSFKAYVRDNVLSGSRYPKINPDGANSTPTRRGSLSFRRGHYQEISDLRTLGWPIQTNGTFWNILKSRIIKQVIYCCGLASGS